MTYFRNWLLAVLGSPTTHTLMSPRRRVPSVVALGTPPISISSIPLFTSSLPAPNTSHTDINRHGPPHMHTHNTIQLPVGGAFYIIFSSVLPCLLPTPLTVNGGEHGCDEILIEVAVLAHLKDLLPLWGGEAGLNLLQCHIMAPDLARTKLWAGMGMEGGGGGGEID